MPHVGNFPIIYYPKPLPIGPGEFVLSLDTYDWEIGSLFLRNRTTLTSQWFYAPVFLPHGATVIKFRLKGYRTAAGAILKLRLIRAIAGEESSIVADLLADWTGGIGSIETTDIAYPTIDNDTYYYFLWLNVEPDAAVDDVRFYRAVIDWD